MSSKTFTPKLGDKWTTYLKQSMMYLYRDGECTFFRENRSGESPSRRQPGETDLPTPDAHAQLREWGYEVTGDAVTSTTTPSGMVIETRYVFPGEYRIEKPITESRVREIVAQMLAAHPTPAEVREVAPEPDWKGLLKRVCDAETKREQIEAIEVSREHLARTNGGGK